MRIVKLLLLIECKPLLHVGVVAPSTNFRAVLAPGAFGITFAVFALLKQLVFSLLLWRVATTPRPNGSTFCGGFSLARLAFPLRIRHRHHFPPLLKRST